MTIPYILTSFSGWGLEVRRSFPTKEEAVEYARGIAAYMEEDADNEGCFDLFTKGGEVLALVPLNAGD